MSRPTTSRRHQKAVYWAALDTGNPSDYDSYGHRKITSTKVELDVRIVEGERQSPQNQGDPESYDASLVVDRDIPNGSIFWLGGGLDDYLSETTPNNYYKVVNFNKTPDIKGRRFRRSVDLMRHGDSLPATG